MSMQRWDPWTDMLSLRDAMGQLLEESYVRPTNARAATAGFIPVDVWQDADNVEVSAALPGLRPEDVDVSIQADVLTIKAQTKNSEERKQGHYLVREQRVGSFYRAIQLPVQVDSQRTQAQYENGILHLTLPKAEAVKPRRIQINAGKDIDGNPKLTNGHTPSQQAVEPSQNVRQ